MTALMNAGQKLVAKYLYDPFGRILASSGPLAEANLYRFSSKEAHEFSGLVDYGARFYDPNLQRWLNQDPIEEEGGINLYGFVDNDSINWFDLDGLHKGNGRNQGRSGNRFGMPGPQRPVFRIPWSRPLTKQERDAFLIACLRERMTENARRRAVEEAWRQEKELVRRTGEGTTQWSRPQKQELLETGGVTGYEGHHINNVAIFPEHAGNPNNIAFRTRADHFAEHGFNWRNPTSGPMLNRTPWIK